MVSHIERAGHRKMIEEDAHHAAWRSVSIRAHKPVLEASVETRQWTVTLIDAAHDSAKLPRRGIIRSITEGRDVDTHCMCWIVLRG
jgi:hypothetical protein